MKNKKEENESKKIKPFVFVFAPLIALPFLAALKAIAYLTLGLLPEEPKLFLEALCIIGNLAVFIIAIILYVKLLKKLIVFFEENNPF